MSALTSRYESKIFYTRGEKAEMAAEMRPFEEQQQQGTLDTSRLVEPHVQPPVPGEELHEKNPSQSRIRSPGAALPKQALQRLELAPFNLDSILASEQTSEAFKEFVTEQLCVENYLFWKAAQEYRILAKDKIKTEPVAVMRDGLAIWQTYLEPGSKFEVSLPSKDFSQVQDHLKRGQFGIYTFAVAQDRAYRDMLQDTLPKFGKSSAYQDMIRSLALDLAPQIVENKDKTWKCKMCNEVNTRRRVACSNCNHKHSIQNFLQFSTVLEHPLGQAVLQTWLRKRSRARDRVILDYILAVKRLKEAPFSKEEQTQQCSQLVDTVRPLLNYILPDGWFDNHSADSTAQISVKTLVDSLPRIIERLRTSVYPRFVKSSVHRWFIKEVRRLQKDAAGETDFDGEGEGLHDSDSDEARTDIDSPGSSSPPRSPAPSVQRFKERELDDSNIDDFAAMLSRPKALTTVKLGQIREEVKQAEYERKFWDCMVCKKKENPRFKVHCSNCGLHMNQQLDEHGKIVEGSFQVKKPTRSQSSPAIHSDPFAISSSIKVPSNSVQMPPRGFRSSSSADTNTPQVGAKERHSAIARKRAHSSTRHPSDSPSPLGVLRKLTVTRWSKGSGIPKEGRVSGGSEQAGELELVEPIERLQSF